MNNENNVINNKIKIIKRMFYRAYERFFFGFSREDTWSIDSWFCEIIPKMLRYFRLHLHSYPYGMTEKEWSRKLRMMESLFRNANPNKDNWEIGTKRPLYKRWEKHQQFSKGTTEFLKYSFFQNWCKNKGFEMFSKYYYDLWD